MRSGWAIAYHRWSCVLPVGVLVIPARQPAFLVALLGGLTALDAMSIDIYMPATPLLQLQMHAQASQIQNAMAAFLVGIVLGQVIWGPLSDRFGRKRPLLAGLVLFCLGSILCVTSNEVGSFIAARMIQAVGASSGMVITRAIVRDVYSADDSARVYALLMQILGATSILSPPIGGALLLMGSWQPIFMLLLLIGLCFLVGATRLLPETLHADHRIGPRFGGLGAAVSRLSRSWGFLAPTLAGALSLAGMFAILTGSAFYFVQSLRWTPLAYALLYGFTGLGFIGACQINVSLLRTWSPGRICAVALVIQAILGAMLAAAFLLEAQGGLLVAVLMSALLFILGFIASNATAIAMNAAGEHSGIASSYVGIVQFSLSTLVVPLVTLTAQVGLCMALTVFGASLGAAACGLLSDPRKGRANQSANADAAREAGSA